MRYVMTVLAAMSLAVSASAQMFVFENPLVGEKAPAFKLKTTQGKEFNYPSAVGGKNSILFFWATWCPHCREAIKDMAGRAEEFKKNNVDMILVDVGEDFKEVNDYLQRNKISFDVLLDPDGQVSENYAVIGFPTFVYVDSAGEVLEVQHSLPEDYAEIFKP